MNPASRRNFAKGLGLTGLFLAGVAGYKEVKERIVYKQDELPTDDLEKQLEGKPVVQLVAIYGTPKPKNPNNFYIQGYGEDYVEGTRKEVSVRLVPGPDGKLYVKENDTWRKI
jgi:hypothetical protein